MREVSKLPDAGTGERLRGRAEFREVLNRGRRVPSERVLLYVLPGTSDLRTGFVCGRGVGNAVRRNRARRLLREAWRTVSPRVRGGADVVVVALPSIRGAKAQDVAADVARALESAGVMGP